MGKENEKSKVNDQSSSGPKTTQESQEDQEHFNVSISVGIINAVFFFFLASID